MNAPRIALKPVKLDLEKLKPVLKEIFAHYGERFAQQAEEDPELLIASLLLRIKDDLSEPGGCTILVEGALYDMFIDQARELLARKSN